MKVCVIGAGPSGLTTIKQLLDQGQDVTCFERDDDIGGIWRQHAADGDEMKVFDSLVLTVSMKLMSFSDFMHEGDRTFTDHRGYLKYIREYTQTFNLRDYIQFQTKVESVTYEDGNWQVRVSGPDGIKDHTFEALAVCTGPFHTPNDEIAELAGYAGRVTHSAHYRNAEEFAGKRVLVVGLAESGADVVREVSEVAEDCTLVIRSRTFLLPRLFFGQYSTDMMTWRAHHHEEWVRATKLRLPMPALWGNKPIQRVIFLIFAAVYGFFTILFTLLARPFRRRPEITSETLNNLGQPMLPLKIDISVENSQENIDAINEWNDKSHNGEGNWTQRKIFCKNVGFIPNIVSGKIQVKDCGIDNAEGRDVRFNDGDSQEFDEVVLCTGFIRNFPNLGNIKIDNIRDLYKLAFHPEYGGRLAFIGFVRPHSGGIPACAEMQARYFASLCSGRIELPPDVEQRIAREKRWYETFTALSPRHQESIPSQTMFMDSMAREIGCLLPMSKLLFEPRLFVKHWYCSFNQSCYRLVGPNSDPENAKRELMAERLPADGIRYIVLMMVLSVMPHSVHPKNLEMEL